VYVYHTSLPWPTTKLRFDGRPAPRSSITTTGRPQVRLCRYRFSPPASRNSGIRGAVGLGYRFTVLNNWGQFYPPKPTARASSL
jgi:hypothetical protein